MQKYGIFIAHYIYTNFTVSRRVLEKINPTQQQINSKNFAKVNIMHYIRIIMINKNSQ
jgi:hypothetical protein